MEAPYLCCAQSLFILCYVDSIGGRELWWALRMFAGLFLWVYGLPPLLTAAREIRRRRVDRFVTTNCTTEDGVGSVLCCGNG